MLGSSRAFQPAWGKNPLSFHLYREVAHQKQMQRKILESTNSTELRHHRGSIAHELNNPLRYAQLRSIDQNGFVTQRSWKSDYDEIAELDMPKTLFKNLLGFTRQSQLDQPEKFPF